MVYRLTLTKAVALCHLPINDRSFPISIFQSSVFVTTISTLATSLFVSVRMFVIAEEESNYPGVHASWMLSWPTSITSCILFIQLSCLLYLSGSTLYAHRRCHFWSPVTAMVLDFISLQAIVGVSYVLVVTFCWLLILQIVRSSSLSPCTTAFRFWCVSWSWVCTGLY